MFLVIGIWGSRERKIRAVYLFFFYTLIGSLFMLLAILYLYNKVGSTNYDLILAADLSLQEQTWLWLAFFLSLATKMRSVEHTSELQSLMRISYAVFCLKKNK